jgi:hypothetical protein
MGKVSSGGSGKDREIVPADGYDCWCYGSVEMGTQDGEYQGEATVAKKIRLFFEIPELLITYEKDGKEVTAPQVINVEYTNSNGKKAKIKPILEAWTGKSIDDIDLVTDLIGRPARIGVVHKTSAKGSVYANIATIAKAKDKDVKALPPMHNPAMGFCVDDHGFESDEFKAVYEWLRKDIMKSHEYKEHIAGPSTSSVIDEDDLPFK